MLACSRSVVAAAVSVRDNRRPLASEKAACFMFNPKGLALCDTTRVETRLPVALFSALKQTPKRRRSDVISSQPRPTLAESGPGSERKRHENNDWQMGAGVLQPPSAFDWSGLNVSNQELEFELCHSIGVCARRPLWAANETSSSALSALSCSASAASGRRETALPACAKPRKTRRPMRSEECGVRNE